MDQKHLSGKILATPVAIGALVILIAIGAYLAYAIYQSKQIEEVETPAVIAEPSDNSNTSFAPDKIEPSDVSNGSEVSKTTVESVPSDETADWQTYTNDKYGFSLKYPSDWSVRNLTASNSQIIALKAFYALAPKNLNEDSFFQIMISSQTMEQLLLGATLNLSENQQVEAQEAKVVKYGKIGNKITIKNTTTNHSSTTYYFELDDGITVKVTGETTDDNKNSEIANQIVETFEFTQ